MRSKLILLLLLVSLASCSLLVAAESRPANPPASSEKAAGGSSPGLIVKYAEHYPDTQPGLACIGDMVDVSSKDGKCPPNAKLALSWIGEDASRYGVKNLRIYWYDPKKKAWDKPLDTTIDNDKQIVTASISKLGTYAIGAMPVGDKEAPQVLWLLPRPNEVISGTTRLLVAPRDNVGVYDLHFIIEIGDGERDLGDDMTAMDGSWGVEADFSPYKTGDYTIIVEASDAEGNTGVARQKVHIESKTQAPGVTIVSGPTFDPKTGDVIVTGTVSGVAGKMISVGLELDGEIVSSGEITDSKWTSAFPGPLFVPGKHVLTAIAMDENANQSRSKSMNVTLPLSALDLDADERSPQLSSKPITLTALATGGSKVEYKFEVNDGKGSATLRDFAAGNTCAWTPAAVGKYSLRATARESGTDVPFAEELDFDIAGPLTGVTLAVTPKSPQTINSMIVLTATAAGGAQLEYKCEVNDGKGWEIFSDWYWDNGGVWFAKQDGTYTFRITVREQGTTKTFTAEDTSGYAIKTVHDPVAALKLPDGTWVQFSPMVVTTVTKGRHPVVQVKARGSKTVTEVRYWAREGEEGVKVGQILDICGQMSTEKGKRYVMVDENQGWLRPVEKHIP